MQILINQRMKISPTHLKACSCHELCHILFWHPKKSKHSFNCIAKVEGKVFELLWVTTARGKDQLAFILIELWSRRAAMYWDCISNKSSCMNSLIANKPSARVKFRIRLWTSSLISVLEWVTSGSDLLGQASGFHRGMHWPQLPPGLAQHEQTCKALKSIQLFAVRYPLRGMWLQHPSNLVSEEEIDPSTLRVWVFANEFLLEANTGTNGPVGNSEDCATSSRPP